jgi:hypothetical protein
MVVLLSWQQYGLLDFLVLLYYTVSIRRARDTFNAIISLLSEPFRTGCTRESYKRINSEIQRDTLNFMVNARIFIRMIWRYRWLYKIFTKLMAGGRAPF